MQSNNDSPIVAVLATDVRQRKGIMILGMHRSGTRLLPRLLNMSGCDLPRHFRDIEAEGDHASIVSFNDVLLASGGFKWYDWRGFDTKWKDGLKKGEYLDQARELILDEFGNSELFVLSDPRICRLFFFWLEVLEQEHIQPLFLLPIQNPALVAQSLALHENIIPAVGQLIWLRHVLEAEAASRGRPRAFLTVAQIVDDWEASLDQISSALGVQWQAAQTSRMERVGFIDPDMIHAEATLQDHPDMALPAMQVWTILADWASTGEKASDHVVLDGLLKQLDSAGEVAGEAILLSMSANWFSVEQKQKVDELTGHLSENMTELDSRRQELNSLEYALAQVNEQLAAARILISENKNSSARIEEQYKNTISDSEQKSKLLRQKLIESINSENKKDEYNEIIRSELESLSEKMKMLRENSNNLELERNSLSVQYEHLKGNLATTESNLRQRYAELDQVRAAESKQIEDNNLLRAEIVEARERTAASEKECDAIRGEMEAALSRLNDAVRHNHQLEQLVLSLRNRIDIVEAARASANQRSRMLESVTDALKVQDLRVARLTEELQKTRARVDVLDRAEQDKAHLESELRAAKATYSENEARLSRQIAEQQDAHNLSLRNLAAQADQMQRQVQVTLEQKDWLLAVNQAMVEPGRWWFQFLPPSYRQRKIRRRLARRGLFDGDAYMARYDDVVQSGMDPLEHYIRHGIYEGRVKI